MVRVAATATDRGRTGSSQKDRPSGYLRREFVARRISGQSIDVRPIAAAGGQFGALRRGPPIPPRLGGSRLGSRRSEMVERQWGARLKGLNRDVAVHFANNRPAPISPALYRRGREDQALVRLPSKSARSDANAFARKSSVARMRAVRLRSSCVSSQRADRGSVNVFGVRRRSLEAGSPR